MEKDVRFSSDEVERLLDLLREQQDGVESGSIVPGQPREYELEDIKHLILKLER